MSILDISPKNNRLTKEVLLTVRHRLIKDGLLTELRSVSRAASLP